MPSTPRRPLARLLLLAALLVPLLTGCSGSGSATGGASSEPWNSDVGYWRDRARQESEAYGGQPPSSAGLFVGATWDWGEGGLENGRVSFDGPQSAQDRYTRALGEQEARRVRDDGAGLEDSAGD